MVKEEEDDKWSGWLKPSCIPITIILVLIVLVVLLPLLDQKKEALDKEQIKQVLMMWDRCGSKCRFTLVESIPENLTYTNNTVQSVSVYDGWMTLLSMAKESIDIASSYWTLRGSDIHFSDPSDWQGERIFKELLKAGTERNIAIRIAQNQPSHYQPNFDTEELQDRGAAKVRNLNFQKLVGGGILHTKMWLVDNEHFYIGSANLDWRSLTQVKEVGAIVYNCSCIAEDMAKIFQMYWMIGLPDAVIPPEWPSELDADYNNSFPLKVHFNDSAYSTYLASSPPQLCPKNRISDIDAILDVIDKAEKFVYVAVMDYIPATIYTRQRQFWPVIDDKLRQAAVERGVTVRLLVSFWNQTKPNMIFFLNSLASLNNSYPGVLIEIKCFIVPKYSKEQAQIPFARVNHNKYMVTDSTAYIGTSNWAGDYFINTGGIGLIVNQTTNKQGIRDQLQAIFDRDWNSEFAHPLSECSKKNN